MTELRTNPARAKRRNETGKPGIRQRVLLLLVLLGFLPTTLYSTPAYAACPCPAIVAARGAQTVALIRAEQQATRDFITQSFIDFRVWLIDYYFKQIILPALAKVTEQMSATAMLQMMIVGTFLDAKNQLETQRLYQSLAARAHKDYYPSEGLCTMGSSMKSLASADRNADLTALLLGARSLDRQLNNANANAAAGPKEDREGRVEQFRKTYCDRNDNNRGLAAVCGGTVTQLRRNKDIDFTRTIANPMTLDIDFSDTALTNDEEDVLALMSNLYAHDVFDYITAAKLRANEGNQQVLLDMRSIAAKRSVAEQSFLAIAGMKSRTASNAAEPYLRAVLEEMGLPPAEAATLLGDNPSYYAQMEILTKRIFQRPEFFVDLYDKPANVARKGVAMQTIAMMQKRDLFKSALRNEAMLSILLELELIKAQRNVQDEMDRLTDIKQNVVP